jgi:hypothetical protein
MSDYGQQQTGIKFTPHLMTASPLHRDDDAHRAAPLTHQSLDLVYLSGVKIHQQPGLHRVVMIGYSPELKLCHRTSSEPSQVAMHNSS